MSRHKVAVGDRVRLIRRDTVFTIAARDGNYFWLRGPGGPAFETVTLSQIAEWIGGPESEPPPSTEIKVGDKVHTRASNLPGEVLGIDGNAAWVKMGEGERYTYALDSLKHPPKPFLPDGDKRIEVRPGGYDGKYTSAAGLTRDERGHEHVIKIDGQTGALSWEKGGPSG